MEISAEMSKVHSMKTKTPQESITINSGKLRAVHAFRYIGATITEDGRSMVEIRHRKAIATQTMARLKTMWRAGKLSIKSQLRLMRAIFMSVALYGCETLTLSAETEWKLQTFKCRWLRKILRVPYTAHRTNTSSWDEVTQAIGPKEHLLAIVFGGS